MSKETNPLPKCRLCGDNLKLERNAFAPVIEARCIRFGCDFIARYDEPPRMEISTLQPISEHVIAGRGRVFVVRELKGVQSGDEVQINDEVWVVRYIEGRHQMGSFVGPYGLVVRKK